MIGVNDSLLIRHTLNDYYYDKSCHKVDSIEDEPKKNKNDMHLDANGNDSIRWKVLDLTFEERWEKTV